MGPVGPATSTNGQPSPCPQADETRRGQRPNNSGRKGAAININEADGLKAFYSKLCAHPGNSVFCSLGLQEPYVEGAWGQEQGWGLKGGKEEGEPESVILAGRTFLTCLPKKPWV